MNKKGLKTSETHFLEVRVDSIPALSTLKTPKLASKEAFLGLEKKTVPKSVLNKYISRKRFLKEKTPYKLPTIIKAKSGDWVVRYHYEYPDNPGKFKPIAVRDGINYIHDLEEKEKAAQQLCSDITYALEKEGYNPFEEKQYVKRHIAKENQEIEKANYLMTLDEALIWYIDTKRGKRKTEKTLSGYKGAVQAFIDWYKPRTLRIDQVTIDEIELYLASRLENEEWKPRTYNNNISALTTFFNYLVAKRQMPINPIGKGMLETISNKAEKNKYYDQETLDKVLPAIQKKPVLRRYILWTYYSCARGSELRGLKVKHLDLNIKKISIMAETGKTGEYVGKRSIPICQELMDIIIEEDIINLPKEYYLFGALGKPGPNPIPETYLSTIYWKIKKDLNIDFKFTIYSFKHTRVVDLLVAGFEPIVVMYLTGHTDWASFQAYIRELGAVMNKKLIGNTLTLKI